MLTKMCGAPGFFGNPVPYAHHRRGGCGRIGWRWEWGWGWVWGHVYCRRCYPRWRRERKNKRLYALFLYEITGDPRCLCDLNGFGYARERFGDFPYAVRTPPESKLPPARLAFWAPVIAAHLADMVDDCVHRGSDYGFIIGALAEAVAWLRAGGAVPALERYLAFRAQLRGGESIDSGLNLVRAEHALRTLRQANP